MKSLFLCLLSLFPSLIFVEAEDISPIPRLIPPQGIEIPDEDRNRLQARLSKSAESPERIRNHLKPYFPLPLGQPINLFAPIGEMGFILILRVIRVSGRSGKNYQISCDGWDGSFELLYYCLHIHCFSLAKNRNYPSQASHFGVKPTEPNSKGSARSIGTPLGSFSRRLAHRPCK